MGYLYTKLTAQLELIAKISRKIFRAVLRVVYIPFELVLQDYVVTMNVQLQHSDALLSLLWLIWSVSSYCLLDRICYLLLVWLQLSILFDQQSAVVFWRHIRLIYVPQEGALELFALHFEVQMDRYQYLR